MLAAQMARTEILSLLVNAGAEKNFRDSSGMTALMYAARAGNDVDSFSPCSSSSLLGDCAFTWWRQVLTTTCGTTMA